MAGCAQGFASKLAINGQQVEFIGGIRDLSLRELVDNGQVAIRGNLDHTKERVTLGRLIVGFEFTCNPSPAELDVYLPLMGFAESPTDTFTLGNTYGTFTSIIDRVTKVHTYTSCVMGRSIFRGQRGSQPNSLTQQVLGVNLTEGASGSFSATALDTDIAYAFTEGVFTYSGTAYAFDRYQWLLDPRMEVQWNNSTTATAICPTDRVNVLSLSTPYTSDEQALFTTPLASAAGAAASLAWSRGNQSTSIAFANLKSLARPPVIKGKGQIRLPLHFNNYRSGSTVSTVITHDATA
jgi:hypothetical protein